VSYVQTTNMVAMNMKQTMTMKQTVKAKDDKEVTLLVEMTALGRNMSNEIKVPLDQPYDPASNNMPKNAKFEKIADGSETLKIGGKDYACTWMQGKIIMKDGTTDVTGTSKTWSCPEVPLSGMVKMESQMTMNMGGQEMKTEMTMELQDCGRGQ